MQKVFWSDNVIIPLKLRIGQTKYAYKKLVCKEGTFWKLRDTPHHQKNSKSSPPHPQELNVYVI